MTENKLQYRLRVVRNASLKKFFDVVNESARLSGQSKSETMRDILHCMKKFSAGYHDYLIFQWWDCTDEQRDTYLTRFRSKRLIEQINDQSLSHCFDNKNEFNEIFKDYIGRTFLDLKDATKEDVIEYFNTHEKIFAKPRDLSCGDGCEKLFTKDFPDGEAFYDYITKKQFGTIEDVIENHPDLAKVYNGSADTMRMITIIDDWGEPHLVYSVQKFGINGRVVDNFGVHGPVDLETGEFLFPAHSGDTKADGLYTHHPNSGEKLVGFHTPLFKEAKEMVLKAAMVIPQMRYVGWDVAITPTGPAIIEGNNFCAHDFWQLPGQTPGGIGMMPVLKELIPSFQY